MNKKRWFLPVIPVCLILSVLYLPFATVNNIDVGLVPSFQVKEYLTEAYSNGTVQIGEQTIRTSDLVEVVGKPIRESYLTYSIELKWKGNADSLLNKDRAVQYTPSEITQDGDIIKGKQGNVLSTSKVKESLLNKLKESTSVILNEKEYLLKEEKPGFEETKEELSKLKDLSIKLKIKDKEHILDWNDIKHLIDILDEPYTIKVNKTSLVDYVRYLDEKYRTLYTPVEYTTIDGETVSLPNTEYGYDLHWESSVQAIEQAITNKLTQVDLPIDVDNPLHVSKNRVEINLSTQQMTLIVDNQFYGATPIVSGSPNTPTNRGIFSIDSKETNRILRGFNQDGSQYAVPVEYWLPFDGGIGIHDIEQRPVSDYENRDTYKWAGSHGCINTPTRAIAMFYNNLEVGYNVIVY